jgi:hypothetical protein
MPPFNAPSWKQITKGYACDAKFGRSASESQLVVVEQALGVRLPDLLREFLLEADGVTADYGSGVIWSAADIQKRNLEFRSLASFRDLYMPFDHLLFFGGDGGGDQFAFAIHADGQIHKHDVYRWDHETDARLWFAGRLEQFLEKRLKKEEEDDDVG